MSDALRAENARLREECDRYKAMYENIHVTAAELRRVRREWKRDREQNAKLRELLQDLAICACGKYCYGCPHQYDGCNRDQRLRELGIEVDG